MAIVGTFNGMDEYHAYANHAVHVELLTSTIKPLVAERSAVQFLSSRPNNFVTSTGECGYEWPLSMGTSNM